MGQTKSFLPVYDGGSATMEDMLIFEGVVGNVTPRKFPSPGNDEGERIEQMTMTSVPVDPVQISDFACKANTSGKNRHCNFVINHEGRFKVLWDWLVLILVMFTAIQIPYYAAFSETLSTVLHGLDGIENRPILTLSLIVDCMFVLDIFLNFRTTYIESASNAVERNPTKLALYYLKTWFIIDLLAAIPFDWIIQRQDFVGGTSDLVGLLKCARLLRLFRVARKLDRYSEYGVAVLFLLMCLFTLIAHWFACIWNAIAKSEEENPNSWIVRMQHVLHDGHHRNTTNIRKMTSSERYVASLYFIVSSMTSVGFGNIAATTEKEQMFSVIIMLVGALMYACIFGNMVAIVQRLYSRASTFHSNINTIREFMKFYKIPEELRNSINNYVRREWTNSKGIDAEHVLQRLPECIQADLTYELYQSLFYKTQLFCEATVSCMRALAMKFKTMTLQQNNFAIRQGEELNKLYVMSKGRLEVHVDGVLVSDLKCYSAFGYDIAKMLKRPKSKGNVRAVSLCEIHFISKDDLLEIMEVYPKFARQFKQDFTHAFDLNDLEEEGYHQTERKKEKTHIATVARQALTVSLPASWHKVTKKMNGQLHSEDGSNGSLSDGLRSPYMNGHFASQCRNKSMLSYSADHLDFVNNANDRRNYEDRYNSLQETTTTTTTAAEKTTYDDTWCKISDNKQNILQTKSLNIDIDVIPKIFLSPDSCNGAVSGSDIGQTKEGSLMDRMYLLENEVYKMQTEIDAKLSILIDMFNEMKMNNDGKIAVNKQQNKQQFLQQQHHQQQQHQRQQQHLQEQNLTQSTGHKIEVDIQKTQSSEISLNNIYDRFGSIDMNKSQEIPLTIGDTEI